MPNLELFSDEQIAGVFRGFTQGGLEFHADLLEAARDDARLILSRDTELQSERGEALLPTGRGVSFCRVSQSGFAGRRGLRTRRPRPLLPIGDIIAQNLGTKAW